MNTKKESERPMQSVFVKEPLMRLIDKFEPSPFILGIWFLIIVSAPLSVAGAFYEPDVSFDTYLGYFGNISWSLSMLFLFPIIVGLTVKYYRDIPSLFEYLGKGPKDNNQEKEYHDFLKSMDKAFNKYWVSLLIFVLTLISNYIYLNQIFDERLTSWMTSGHIFETLAPITDKKGLSWLGLWAMIVQIILIYWVVNLVWRGFVFSWQLHKYFNVKKFNFDINPLNPDECSGLRKIRTVSMTMNLIIFLIGLYLSLKVIDKMLIQGLTLTSDIGNPIFWGIYIVLAPSLFFLSLGAAHNRMKEAKLNLLQPMGQKIQTQLEDFPSRNDISPITEIKESLSLYQLLVKTIPVWPLNFRSLRAFFGAIVVPVLPVVLPLAFRSIVKLLKIQ